MGEEHVFTVTGDSKIGSSIKREAGTFIITAVKIEDGGNGLFGGWAHQLYYGAEKYFTYDVKWERSVQILREKAAKDFINDAGLFSDTLIGKDVETALKRAHLLGGDTEKNMVLRSEAVASFGEYLRKPGYFCGEILIGISVALKFGFSFNDYQNGLIILEESFIYENRLRKHIAFLVKKWREDIQCDEYYSVISVAQKH